MQTTQSKTDLLDFGKVHDEEWVHLSEARRQLGLPALDRREHCAGLALSGGGIRSATFCLGVLQALARQDKLKQIDYLSTVSGGGYVGSWLSAWIHQKGYTRVDPDLKGVASTASGEAPEVTWLRRYSNYLAPRLGLLSVDTLALVATWFRNVLLNLVIVVSFLALLFVLPRLLLEPTIVFFEPLVARGLGYAAAWIGFFIFPLAIAIHLSSWLAQDENGRVLLLNRTFGVFLVVMLPGALTAFFGSIALFGPDAYFRTHPWPLLSGAAWMLCLGGPFWLVYQFLRGRGPAETLQEAGIFALAYACTLLVGAGLVAAFADLILPVGTTLVERAANVLTFGPPAIYSTFGVAGAVIVGLVGRSYSERSREWWSRMNAWFIIIALTWLAVFALAFYAAPVFSWVRAQAGDWIAGLLGASWVGGLLVSLLAPKPGSSETLLSKFGRVGFNVALSVVVAGMLFGVAAITGSVVGALGVPACKAEAAGCEAGKVTDDGKKRHDGVSVDLQVVPGSSTVAKLEAKGDLAKVQIEASPGKPTVATLSTRGDAVGLNDQVRNAFTREEDVLATVIAWNPGADDSSRIALVREPASGHAVDLTWAVFVLLLVVLVVFGFRVNVNKFSLHSLYKNRLTRCYLGASRQATRRPHPFTGFDDHDDLSLHAMREMPSDSGGATQKVRPLHIINTAINITQGRNLAWQERKAASFSLTPLRAGFTLGPSTGDSDPTSLLSTGLLSVGGYRDTAGWASIGDERPALSLGSAMATSGAAVSTNSGKASSPALAFVSTIFNARLGRWSPNPLGAKWRNAGPHVGLLCLLQELFGYSDEVSDYVHLSDGGHFDNTGAYELVRRRCRTIIIVDATADPDRSMADLANFVRKCRIDFGVNVIFNVDALGADPKQQALRNGYVFGSIDYGPGSAPGVLAVIKPTLVGARSLSADVFSYARAAASFPHQSTVDQFFSESQFESYRVLGETIATACLRDTRCPLT